MIVLHKKGNLKNIKNFPRLSVYLLIYTNCSHGYYTKTNKQTNKQTNKNERKRLLMKTNQENKLVSEKVTRQLSIFKQAIK